MGQETNLEAELNLSSLDRVELLGALEDRYQVDLSETRFAAVKTVGDLERMLHGKLPPRALSIIIRHGCSVGPPPGCGWSLTTCFCVRRYFCWDGRASRGRENLRGLRGPVLVVCNHIDDVDVGFVQTALPARFRHRLATATGGEALEALRTPPSGRSLLGRVFGRVQWMLGVSLLNLFPLPREAGFRESFAFAGESVDRGYSILVFPEGRHTTDGKMRPFRAGVGLLANNLAIPVVPIRIDGLFELKKTKKKFAPPGKIQVKIGVPVRFPRGSAPEWIAAELQKAVENL